MTNKPTPADFSPTVPDFPVIGQYQPIYGKFDLTTYIQGASDYEIMAFLVQCYNATLKGYSDVTQLSKDTVTAYNQLQTWVNTWFDKLDVQNEVNAKLEQMRDSGELARIISSSEVIVPVIDNYFASQTGNTTLYNETSKKINEMAYNGTLTSIVKETGQISPAVTAYINSAEGARNLSNITAQKIEQMAANGELGTVISRTTDLQKTTTDWLTANVTPVGSAVTVDKSLSIEGAAADAKETGAIRKEIADKIPVGVEIKNYLNVSKLHKNGYIDTANGSLIAYDGWSYSDFLTTKAGAVLCTTLFDTVTNTWALPVSTYVAFYDANKNFISGEVSNPNTTYTVPANCAYMRVSMSDYFLGFSTMLIVEKTDFDAMTNPYDRIPYGNYIPSIYDVDGSDFITIRNPYCLAGDSKLYFRFDAVVYFRNGVRSVYDYDFPAFKGLFPNNWQGYPTSKVKDCMFIKQGEALVLNTLTNVLSIVQIPYFLNNLGENTVILGFDEKGYVFGVLAKQYRDLNDNDYERQRFTTLSNDVLTELYNQTNQVYNTITDEKFCFAWLSDNHMYGTVGKDETDMTDLAIGYTDKSINFDAIFNTGDSIQERNDSSGLNALRKVVDNIDAKKLVYCEGNHDRNVISPILTKLEFYNSVYRHNSKYAVWGSKDNAYFYRDFERYKIRVVSLNVYEKMYDNGTYDESKVGYSNEQLNWLASAALNVGSEWSVIILTHDSPVKMQNNSSEIHNNSLQLIQILESFKNGTSSHITYTDTKQNGLFSVDVTTNYESPGSIIGVMSGHAHCDGAKKVNGINYIQILCAYIDVVNDYAGYANRPAYSDKAYVFDIGIVDSVKRTLSLTRIGYGESRNFTY